MFRRECNSLSCFPYSGPDLIALALKHYNQLHPGGSIPYSDPDVTRMTMMNTLSTLNSEIKTEWSTMRPRTD